MIWGSSFDLMNTPNYTPSDMVRLEILAYQTPEGLHPVEEAWRNLARKLLLHVNETQKLALTYKEKVNNINYLTNDLKDWKPMKFPTPFSESVE